MRFPSPLVPGHLIRRYKRFLADVVLETGEEVTTHCPNPGSMLGLAEPGTRVWLERNTNPRRKLAYGWRVSELPRGHYVGIDTSVPNRVVKEALLTRAVPELAAYGAVRPEVRYGTRSRVDFLLTDPDLPEAWVEVKNVHLCRSPGWAEFPDCVTARGARHLRDLADKVAEGQRAVMFYLVQRTDCARFRIAADLDPIYAAAFAEARAAGVEILCYGTRITPEGVEMASPLPVG